jgi:integrase/recombinase XerD
MVGEQITQNHPSAGLPLPKRPERLPQVLSREQVFSLLDDPFRPELEPSPKVLASGRVDARPQAAFHRDKAILEVLYGCGLRVSELCGLDRRDVMLGDEMVRVMGKGSKERVVPILGTAKRALAAYLQDWRPVLANASRSGDAVFLNERGGRITRQAVHRMVERYGAIVGIKGLHPHTLRHTYATHMLEGGMDLRYVQELLGHASISTTQLYTHIDLTHVRMVYLEAHPRAREQKGHVDQGGASTASNGGEAVEKGEDA